MKTLIYQYWNGNLQEIASESRKNIKAYADSIGADYRFDHNENYTKDISQYPNYYDALRPVFDDDFLKFDKVLFLDMDIFVIEGTTDNIFDLPVADVGICEEEHMVDLKIKSGKYRKDEKWHDVCKTHWGTDVPKNQQNKIRIFNSGVVMYTREGLIKARKNFVKINEYINVMRKHGMDRFYQLDQNYLNAMIFSGRVNTTIIPQQWNSQVHWAPKENSKSTTRPVIDCRKSDAKFVHVQLTGSGSWSIDKINQVVNKPVEEWKL